MKRGISFTALAFVSRKSGLARLLVFGVFFCLPVLCWLRLNYNLHMPSSSGQLKSLFTQKKNLSKRLCQEMTHLRRILASLKLAHCRHNRQSLWFILIGVVVAFVVVNVLLNFLSPWVESKNKAVNPSANWLQMLKALNPIRLPGNGLRGTSVLTVDTEAQRRPVAFSSDCTPPHMIWDTNLRYTDRIVEQINYIPKRRRLSSAHILVYNKGGGENIPPGNTLFKNNHCLVANCNITIDPYTDLHVDAVVTSMPINTELLKNRRPEDVYVFYQLESPMATFISQRVSGFNWTATYRQDSTIVSPYDKWVSFDNNTRARYFQGIDTLAEERSPKGKNYAAGKRKMAVALISNCMGKRMLVISELAKYIHVDVYGLCGTPCGSDCLEMIRRDYKFFLAFENANCVDYITEKFYRNALSNNIVPVVFGAPPSDFVRAAPPYSYIHVDNYPTVRHLAAYLQELDKNDDMYNVYFKWKGTGSFINTLFWCRLCAMVNDLDKPYMSIPDVVTWFSNNACV